MNDRNLSRSETIQFLKNIQHMSVGVAESLRNLRDSYEHCPDLELTLQGVQEVRDRFVSLVDALGLDLELSPGGPTNCDLIHRNYDIVSRDFD